MDRRDQWVGGAVLITIGVGLLLGQLFGDAEQYVLLGIGVVLLVIFAASRNPGTLIGGCIVTGLGIGVVAATVLQDEVAGAAVLFGLGGGFIAIWLIGTVLHMQETVFWPLVPGAILIVLGVVVLAGTEAAQSLELVWPVLLIALGVIVLIGAMFGRRSGSGGEPPAPR